MLRAATDESKMLILALIAAVIAPVNGKTMASDEWHQMKIISVGRGASPGPPYYVRVQAGDLDGDGIADQADIKLVCADGVLKESLYSIVRPRDSTSGQSSGRRSHEAIAIVTDWVPASPQLSSMRPSYDVKKMQGSRAVINNWSPITLRNADGLCASTATAAAAIVKSKSNISNN
ncbi:MAG: hypothetical protein NVS3B5_05280 [Sphingomicrobium sp.]